MRQSRIVVLGAVLAALAVAPVLGATVESKDLVPAKIKARSQVMPYYPATATLSRVQATVSVVAEIGADGRVARTEVLGCDQPGFGFEESSTDAVDNWRFRPAQLEGEAVASTTLILLQFAPPQRGNLHLDTATASALLRPVGSSERFQAFADDARMSGGFDSDTISTSALGSGQQAPTAVEGPPCGPGSGRCMYDRSLLNRKPADPVRLPRPVASGR